MRWEGLAGVAFIVGVIEAYARRAPGLREGLAEATG